MARSKVQRCKACEVATINGILCHEAECPESWRTEVRSCKWCGSTFHPDGGWRQFCEDSCYRSYYGFPDDEG